MAGDHESGVRTSLFHVVCTAGKKCNRAENEERHKRISAQGGQIHQRLNVAFKAAWDRWQFKTITADAPAGAEIRDFCSSLLSGACWL